jgi:hypothetical protein
MKNSIILEKENNLHDHYWTNQPIGMQNIFKLTTTGVASLAWEKKIQKKEGKVGFSLVQFVRSYAVIVLSRISI